MTGFVSIVGAGPWDPALLTVAALQRLRRADVVVADYLVNPSVLLHAPRGAEILQRVRGPAAEDGTMAPMRMRQADINALLVDRAKQGKYVVRLKGGDPCMFGRGGEEAEVLVREGIGFELVPGVSSPIAAPQTAGIPVTHRDHTPAVTFVSGFEAYEKAGLTVAWQHLAQSAGTIVLMMSVRNARDNARRLVEAGRDPATPAAAVRWGTRGIQRTVVGTLADIADRMAAAKFRAPSVLVVGEVVTLRERIAWLEQRPLFGRRVVVTRALGDPLQEEPDLAGLLAAAGADVVTFPCQAIAPPRDPEALRRSVAARSEYDGILLTSKSGVAAFFDALAARELDARSLANKTVVAVGAATAASCVARGVRPDLVPDDANSEGLVEALRERGWASRRWLHVRAEQGRDVLQQAIEGAGGRYTLAIGYRIERPAVPPMLVQSLLPAVEGGEAVDAICFASTGAARNFLRTVAESIGDTRARALVERAAIVAIGPVTAAGLESMGFSVAATAASPDDEGLAAAVVDLLGGPASEDPT